MTAGDHQGHNRYSRALEQSGSLEQSEPREQSGSPVQSRPLGQNERLESIEPQRRNKNSRLPARDRLEFFTSINEGQQRSRDINRREPPGHANSVNSLLTAMRRSAGGVASLASSARELSARAVVGLVLISVLVLSVILGLFWGTKNNGQTRPLSQAEEVVTARLSVTPGEARSAAASDDPAQASASGGSSPPDSADSTASGALLTVAVVCHVQAPGLVRVPAGARIDDAVQAAGGLSEGGTWDGLNRAQKLADGVQICVGGPDSPGTLMGGEPTNNGNATGGSTPSGGTGTTGGAASDGGAQSTGGASGKVNINTASATELTAISGVGPKTAAAIIDYREHSGPFRSVDQLAEVKGIGPAKLAAMRDSVTV